MLDNPDAAEKIAAYERFGKELLDSMFPPDLYDVEWSVWESFWELSTERQIGMAAGPIPVSKIVEHAGRRSGVPCETLVRLIRDMDAEFLKPPPKETLRDAMSAAKEKDGNGNRGARPKGRSPRG